MSKIKYISVFLLFVLSSCQFFESEKEKEFVARVNDQYLYQEDIEDLVNENTTPEDSAIIVNNYITRWATQQLLVDRAKVNLPYETQQKFEELVQRYKNELYTKAYSDAFVAKRLDTSLSQKAITEYYEENRENFHVNEDLVKLRYISISKENTNVGEVKDHFRKFEKKDIAALNDMRLQFNSFSFNDSVWVKTRAVYERIPVLGPEMEDQFLREGAFLELEDSLNSYFVKVNEVKLRNEEAPLAYVEPLIRQILLNRKKLELIKELEKDITKDAIKNKKFEINN